jgi:alcohol dehydrogenase (cytochrome c)
MPKSDLSPASVWQVITYLHSESLAGNPFRRTVDAPARLAVRAITPEDLALASAGAPDWLTYSGAYNGQRQSPLEQINRNNVAALKLGWIFQFQTDEGPVNDTPLVADGVMFVNLPDGRVWALDGATGETLWTHPGRSTPRDFVRPVEGLQGRGMAVLGTTLYVPTADAHLLAIDSRNGEVLWDVAVADYKAGYSITGAPLALREQIVVGVAGSDRGVQGFLDAYSPIDGKRIWRFNTVPGPNEPGHETWGTSDLWRRGGGLTATTGSYDPALDLVYWGVGNPSPAFQAADRPGDNLYTSSVIALEARTGHLRWYFQLMPRDVHDWGAMHTPVLVDEAAAGTTRRLLLLASRNGFLYKLERANGKFISAAPFAHQSWNGGFAADGRPIELPNSHPTLEGTVVYPGHAGATGWVPPSYDPSVGLLFVSTRTGYANIFYKSNLLTWPDGSYWGGRAGPIQGVSGVTEIRAIDHASGAVRWTYRFPGRVNYAGGGSMSTRGGLVFAGEKSRFVALDADSGRELWHFNTGETIDAAPITYRIAGHQFVSIVAGRALLTFALDN